MLRQQLLQLVKNILNIYKYYDIGGWIHAFQITVFTVKNAVHDTGSIIKKFISKALAYRRSLINKISFFACQNQILRLVLKQIVLSPAAEYILIMADFNNGRRRIFL